MQKQEYFNKIVSLLKNTEINLTKSQLQILMKIKSRQFLDELLSEMREKGIIKYKEGRPSKEIILTKK